ncbi:Putative metallophosphoesterase MG207 homolog [Acholeplasma hippikon]|uniref:Phosphoesterase n=1 Tax=Acholeplasma hippikon TaxID=264636 RepID=A0A449BJB6_9MOLU|nr:Putative metallophosphoesterase MG207 homolog [Acholeplasma hippikon]
MVTIEQSKMIAVKGNNDYFLDLPLSRIIDFDGKKILLVHGHMEDVKYGLGKLQVEAFKNKVDICIFGHTHEAFYKNIEGVEFINPGALSGLKDKSYAVYESGRVSFINADWRTSVKKCFRLF